MRTLITLIVFVLLIGAVIGWFQGWFEFRKTGDSHQVDVNVTVNKDKFREETEKAKAKARDLIGAQPKDTSSAPAPNDKK
jgi:hypothetical protein